MIMNYVLSFCKITAASRIFSRNFYLPLLKPITPKDALRTFKITGKWLLGSKIHHYIPVLYNHKKKRSKKQKDYGQIEHKHNDSYTYMSPILDVENNENHKLLANVLDSGDVAECFVYTVDDKMYQIVFPAKFEFAIRNGDIIDVLVSQSSDKILLKLKDFKKVAMELQYYDNGDVLLKGEGSTTEDEERFHHHGRMTMNLAKIFEAKELADEWELEMMKIVSRKKKQKGEGSKEWNDMIEESIQNLDWQKFEVDAKKVIDQIWEPAHEEHIGMKVEDLEKTRNVPDFICRQGSALMSELPLLTEIPDVVKSMATAVYEELYDEENDATISGISVVLSTGKKCFIPGQIVLTDEGEVFVPGQTIENGFGLTFAPGITVSMGDKPTLIKGLIMGEDNEKPMFLPTESSITADGELTFCRNPEEKVKAKPKKIFVKKSGDKKKKKKKKKVTEMQDVIPEIIEPPIPDKEIVFVEVEEIELEPLVCVEQTENDVLTEPITEEFSQQSYEEEYLCAEENRSDESITEESITERSSNDDDVYKPIDDGMDKLIENLQDKKSELQQKLEALRNLTITLENSVTYVNSNDSDELALEIIEDPEKMHKISDALLTITRKANTFRERNNVNIQNIHNPSMIYNNTFVTEADEKFHACSDNLKVLLKSAMYAANEIFKTRPKHQLLALRTVADIIKNISSDEKSVEELCCLMKTNLDRNEICTTILKELTQEITENKLDVLKSAITLSEKDVDSLTVLEKIMQVLDDEPLALAFKKLARSYENLSGEVLKLCKLKFDTIKTEMGAKEELENCVIQATKKFAEESLSDLDEYRDEAEISEFISEATGLASTLGLYYVEEQLAYLASNTHINPLSANKATVEFLQRFLTMKKLCERDYSSKNSLQRIAKNPEGGNRDPRLRQLLRESALLLYKSREIKNSVEIPLRLFQEQNFLAIEDCVYQKSRTTFPILISRKGIQAVVPKEAARNVLAGRVHYMLIDESGVTNFKPMHMFSALKLSKNREQRFEDFSIMGGRDLASRTSPLKMAANDVRRTTRHQHNRMTA